MRLCLSCQRRYLLVPVVIFRLNQGHLQGEKGTLARCALQGTATTDQARPFAQAEQAIMPGARMFTGRIKANPIIFNRDVQPC